jgi:hypothetical protein
MAELFGLTRRHERRHRMSTLAADAAFTAIGLWAVSPDDALLFSPASRAPIMEANQAIVRLDQILTSSA